MSERRDPKNLVEDVVAPEDVGRGKGADGGRVCPVCQGVTLIEIRGKLQCSRCHTICETCCEGGRC